MREENLKLILQSYIQSKQCQDECDSPGNLAGEHAPFRPRIDTAQFYPESEVNLSGIYGIAQGASPPQQAFPFGFEPVTNLPENIIQVGQGLAQIAQEYSVAYPDRSIVRFEEVCLIKEPIEQLISIPVIRDQHLDRVTKVSWKTCDKTAICGTHYVGANGEIIFNQGEVRKEIPIQILKSDDATKDLRFTVELNCGLFDPTPMTVSLRKIENLESSEKSVLCSLPSLPFSVSDVKTVLDDCLNARTFHMALTHLCSTTNKIDHQMALACELSSRCLVKSFGGNALRHDVVLKVLSDFFRRDEYDF